MFFLNVTTFALYFCEQKYSKIDMISKDKISHKWIKLHNWNLSINIFTTCQEIPSWNKPKCSLLSKLWLFFNFFQFKYSILRYPFFFFFFKIHILRLHCEKRCTRFSRLGLQIPTLRIAMWAMIWTNLILTKLWTTVIFNTDLGILSLKEGYGTLVLLTHPLIS